MKRNVFSGLFGAYSAKPITIALNHDDVAPEELNDVLKVAVPNGYAATSPQVIKFLDGEYLVYADGGVEFIPRGESYEARFTP